MLTLRIAQNIALNSNDLFVIFGDYFSLVSAQTHAAFVSMCSNVSPFSVLSLLSCVFFRIMDAGFLKAGQSKSKNLLVHVQDKEIGSLSPTKLESVSFRLYLHYTE